MTRDASSSPTPNPAAPLAHAPLRTPWLVAAWPGMGGVAALAASQLVAGLNAEPMGLVPEQEYFSIDRVEVTGGIARTGALPRSMFFRWRNPSGERDLIVFIGESQPAQNGFALCRRVMEVAVQHGVEQVVTFAAMATALHPQSDPRVFGASTTPDQLETLRSGGVEPLQRGQISGLNGALLAAALERGVPALCLLGEMPFFAANAPNPKAALASVDAFGRLFGTEFPTAALESQAAQMEGTLTQMFEQLQRHQSLIQGGDEEAGADDATVEGVAEGGAEESEIEIDLAPEAASRPEVGAAERRRIEQLFERADEDRSQAFALKEELDRLGLFAAYEDRFLDLFRKGE